MAKKKRRHARRENHTHIHLHLEGLVPLLYALALILRWIYFAGPAG